MNTSVLIHAGDNTAPEHDASLRLLQAFRTDRREPKLNLDARRRIATEYNNQLGPKSLGKMWLKGLALEGRLQYLETQPIPKGVRVRLEAARYHKADRPFIETASASPSRRLVTHDAQGFSAPVCEVLWKHLGVVVGDAEHACDWLGYPRG